jgi:hypothetical protein
MKSDVQKKLVSPGVVTADHLIKLDLFAYLEDTLCFLEQDQGFFEAFTLDKVIGCIHKLSQDYGDFILVDFDLLVVDTAEGVTL